ncbi:hypothetical protein EF847_02405 [Actinobacteria bacterium YIM 96077]|uniref:Type II secretion system protein GspF domain-containing protein n=1 Tax=Phytoactinopolyspora halophila TaxID=1981511 RepID=A0A329R0V7_9ACTN|nr:type II secretion system F family protein [Phytoactinopolyspora halophila]AYY11748.1 hypothetical protein EF847_02405 [Actinobacteria bacterium YIM 96077]RAW17816.1 hypothetical protein DPM12_02870 [Phytoactinopolyspora halophila]
MTAWLSVVLAAAASALLAGGWPSPGTIRLTSILPTSGPVLCPALERGRRPVRENLARIGHHRARLLLCAVAGAAVGAIVAPPGGAIMAGTAFPAAIHIWKRRTLRSARRRREADVAAACLTLSSELRAGRPLEQAMTTIGDEWPALFADAAARVGMGGDPTEALRAASAQPGAQQLAAVAAALHVSATTGAKPSMVLISAADAVRAEIAMRHEADTQLATVRATSQLLALLPVGTLVLFSAGDSAATEFLVRHPVGVACLVVALLGIATGLAWVEHISKAAVRTPWRG